MSDVRGDAELRALERAAREAPGAASWSRLARALARAGERDEAQRVALRALREDPACEVRDLLSAPPLPGSPPASVAWRGLRTLGEPRVLEGAPAAHGHTFPRADLGGGLVGYGTEDRGLAALDVVSGRVAWRLEETSFAPEAVWTSILSRVPSGLAVLVGSGRTVRELRHLDPRTGREVGPRRRLPGSPSSVTWLDAATLLAVEELEHDAERGGEAPLHLVTIDVASWDVVGELVFPHSMDRKWYTDAAGVIVAYPCWNDRAEDLAGFDRTGRELWARATDGAVLGVVDGRVLLGGPRAELRTLDPASGQLRAAGELPFVQRIEAVTDTAVAIAETSRLAALDRTTLAVRWSREDLPGIRSIRATADSLLVLGSDSRAGPATPLSIRALDPATGADLDRRELPEAWTFAHPTLAAGHLVLFRESEDAAVLALSDRE